MIYFVSASEYIEFGQFQSIRARAGTKWSDGVRKKHEEKKTKNKAKTSSDQAEIVVGERKVDEDVQNIVSEVKGFLENQIDLIDKRIPCEYTQQRDK